MTLLSEVGLSTMGLVAAILCLGCLSPNDRAAANPAEKLVETSRIAFRYSTSDVNVNLTSRSTCVATRLTDRWAITAAHCLSGNEETITILCGDGRGKYSGETFRLNAQVTHATHDVKLLQFAQSSFCFAEAAKITRRIAKNASFFAVILPRAQVITSQSPPAGSHASLIEVDRDDHTIQLYDGTACLASGDSGYPVFVEGPAHPYELAGLLISGLEECPSMQTIVRADQLATWITQRIDVK